MRNSDRERKVQTHPTSEPELNRQHLCLIHTHDLSPDARGICNDDVVWFGILLHTQSASVTRASMLYEEVYEAAMFQVN